MSRSSKPCGSRRAASSGWKDICRAPRPAPRRSACCGKRAPIAAAIDAAAAAHPAGAWRLRLLVSVSGDPVVECGPFTHERDRVWRVAIGGEPVASGDWFLRHKTTNREVYNRARAARPDTDDVLLVNERGEITESTIANVVAEIDGVRVTPPVECGLLPGVFRAALLEAGEVQERVISRSRPRGRAAGSG